MRKRLLRYALPKIKFCRAMGRRAIGLPIPPSSQRMLYGRMLGASTMNAGGTLTGVGDINGSDALIPISARRGNLFPEERFIENGQSIGYIISLTDTNIQCKATTDMSDRTVIDEADVGFKEKTVYTLVLKATFSFCIS